MRIISGTMRGTKLYTLDGENTRPTLDRVKEALFSKINEKLDSSIVLDLFSGSGALGLESISRGATKAILCDSNNQAIKIIKQNVDKTKSEDKVLLLECDYKKAIFEIKNNYNDIKFDIVFLDPPYKTNYATESVNLILNNDLLKDDGIIIIETDEKDKIIKDLNTDLVNIFDIKKYGRVYLLFLNKDVKA